MKKGGIGYLYVGWFGRDWALIIFRSATTGRPSVNYQLIFSTREGIVRFLRLLIVQLCLCAHFFNVSSSLDS